MSEGPWWDIGVGEWLVMRDGKRVALDPQPPAPEGANLREVVRFVRDRDRGVVDLREVAKELRVQANIPPAIKIEV